MQVQPLPVHGTGSQADSARQVPGPPGVEEVAQQTRPLSQGDCVPVVQAQPEPVHGWAWQFASVWQVPAPPGID